MPSRRSNALEKGDQVIRKTLKEIKDAGFQQISGPNAWYYPEGPGHPDTVRIHIGGSIDHSGDSTMSIDFVSIGRHGAGRRLRWNAITEKWNLNTPRIDWGGYQGEMEGVLATLGIAS